MDVSAAMRRLDVLHAAPAGRSFELLLHHGTADAFDRQGASGCKCDSPRAATRTALAAGCFAFHARGASAAADLLEQKAALLLPSVRPARQSASGQGSASLHALPSPQTSLSEPELALRLLLALARSAEPALAAVDLAAVLHRHGMHAAGRAAPGGAGATHVHVLAFGVTARAIGTPLRLRSSYGYSGGLDVPAAGALLPYRGAADQVGAGSGGRRDGHAASMLARLHLHTAAAALAAGCVGAAGPNGCPIYAACATADTAHDRTVSAHATRAACAPCQRQRNLIGGGSMPAGRGFNTKLPHPNRAMAPAHTIVPIPRAAHAVRRHPRWSVPQSPSLALARSPPPRGLKPPPLPETVSARAAPHPAAPLSVPNPTGVPGWTARSPASAGGGCSASTSHNEGVSWLRNCPTVMALDSSEGVSARASADASCWGDAGGVRLPLGLAPGDGSAAAAARALLRSLQGLGTVAGGAEPSSALGSTALGGACGSSAGGVACDDPRASCIEATFECGAVGAPRSLSLAARGASARADALAAVVDCLRRGGWGAIGTALGSATGARLLTCSQCIDDVPALIRERSLPPHLTMDHSRSFKAGGTGPGAGGEALAGYGWALTVLAAATHARGATDEHARLASILIGAFEHAKRATCRLEAGGAAAASPVGPVDVGPNPSPSPNLNPNPNPVPAPASGPADTAASLTSPAPSATRVTTAPTVTWHGPCSSATAAASAAHLHSTPTTGDGLLLLEGLYVHLSSPSLLAVPRDRALCLALFRAAARPWLQSLSACAFAAKRTAFALTGGAFTAGTDDSSSEGDGVFRGRGCRRTVPRSDHSAAGSARELRAVAALPSLPRHVAAVAEDCAACVLLLQASAAARRYMDLILTVCGADSAEPPGSFSAIDYGADAAHRAVASALTLPPPRKRALAAARAEWARRFARGEATLHGIQQMYDSHDSLAGASVAAAAAERSAPAELERALNAAWEMRAAAAARESQRALRAGLAGQLEEKATRQMEEAAAEAAKVQEAAEVARLAAKEVEVRKAALVARFEEQMRGAERRARIAQWRASRARGTPARTVALRLALTSLAEEGMTGRILFGAGSSHAAGGGVQEGEEGAPIEGQLKGGVHVTGATPRHLEAAAGRVPAAGAPAEGDGALLRANGSYPPTVKPGTTVGAQRAAPEEGAALAAAEAEAAAVEAHVLASEEAASEAEAAAEAAAIAHAQLQAEAAEAAETEAARSLRAAAEAASEGALRVERARSELLEARRALAAVEHPAEMAIEGGSCVARSQPPAAGLSVQARAEGRPAAGKRFGPSGTARDSWFNSSGTARDSWFSPSGTARDTSRDGGLSGRVPAGLVGGAAAARGRASAQAWALVQQQGIAVPAHSDARAGASLVTPHVAGPVDVPADPSTVASLTLHEAIEPLDATEPAEAIETPVSILLEEFVISPLQLARSILGRASVLYLRRECKLLPWLASLRRFLLAGDGDLMDALAVELHAALASGLIDSEIASGQPEQALGGGAASATAEAETNGGKSSFALQRALELALSRAEIRISAGQMDCTAALRLRWALQPPPAAVCAPAVPSSPSPSPDPSGVVPGPAAARAGTAGGSAAMPASPEDASSAAPLHRIDTFDGVSLTLQLPATLGRLLDTEAYGGVFSFGLRIKRATLAHRSLCGLLGRSVSRAAIPPDARHKLALHAYSLGQLLRSFEQHTLGSDEGWSALCSAVAQATSPADIRAAHSAFAAGIAARCAASDAGLSAVVGAVLGLALALHRDVAGRIRAGPPPQGAGAGTVAAWGAVWRKMIDSSRRQLALLCNALASSGSGFAPLVAAAFPAS